MATATDNKNDAKTRAESATRVASMQATQEAIKRLREAHGDEFAQYVAQERVKRGLSPVPDSSALKAKTDEEIAEAMAKAQRKLEALKAEAERRA